MQLYTFLLGVVAIIVSGGIILALIDLRKTAVRRMAQQSGSFMQKKASKTQFQDYLEQLEPALDQAIKLYDEQVAVCNSEKWPPEQAEKVLKPLKDRIDLLQKVKKYEVIVKPAAKIGDTLTNKINAWVGEL